MFELEIYIYELHVVCFSAPEPECRTDPECLLHEACLQQTCQDPCKTLRCGRNAECKVKSHTAYCVCKLGYEGDPRTVCEERKYKRDNQIGIQFSRKIIFFIAGCKSDSECRDDQACIDRECQNPCLFRECGRNAICQPRNHKANCICPPFHDGDPYHHCEPYECLQDPDCPITLACRDRKCVDPCDCPPNSECIRRNHRGICRCLRGYEKDPYGNCVKSKLVEHWIFLS